MRADLATAKRLRLRRHHREIATLRPLEPVAVAYSARHLRGRVFVEIDGRSGSFRAPADALELSFSIGVLLPAGSHWQVRCFVNSEGTSRPSADRASTTFGYNSDNGSLSLTPDDTGHTPGSTEDKVTGLHGLSTG